MPSRNSQVPRKTLADTLQLLLDSGAGEREMLMPFVKQFPQVIRAALMPTETATVRGIAEFQFGNELRADFVLLQGVSGGFYVKLIEFKSAADRLLNKDGNLRRTFNRACSQIHSWKEYIRNPARGMSLNLELERQFREREILAPGLRGSNPIDNTAKFPLCHVNCQLMLDYAIVIGRHSRTHAEFARIRTLKDELIDVVSWDRLLGAAYGFSRNGKPVPDVAGEDYSTEPMSREAHEKACSEWNRKLKELRERSAQSGDK